MTSSSELTIRVFISSTHNNLLDLRAELAGYINDLGYASVWSGGLGFPDQESKNAVESCLEALKDCSVTVLIIDGLYGSDDYSWDNYPAIKGRKVSPTHAEYLQSVAYKNRLLVFVRKRVWTYYEEYLELKKELLKKSKSNLQLRLKKKLSLPKSIEFRTLELVDEICTKQPIAWITPFDTIVDIKESFKKKMINQLAYYFHAREWTLELIIEKFKIAIGELPPDQLKIVLDKFAPIRQIIEENKKLKAKLGKEKNATRKKEIKKVIDKNEKAIKQQSGNISVSSIPTQTQIDIAVDLAKENLNQAALNLSPLSALAANVHGITEEEYKNALAVAGSAIPPYLKLAHTLGMDSALKGWGMGNAEGENALRIAVQGLAGLGAASDSVSQQIRKRYSYIEEVKKKQDDFINKMKGNPRKPK